MLPLISIAMEAIALMEPFFDNYLLRLVGIYCYSELILGVIDSFVVSRSYQGQKFHQ